MNGRSFPMMVILPVSGEVEKNVPTLATVVVMQSSYIMEFNVRQLAGCRRTQPATRKRDSTTHFMTPGRY